MYVLQHEDLQGLPDSPFHLQLLPFLDLSFISASKLPGSDRLERTWNVFWKLLGLHYRYIKYYSVKIK